jgi:hypothetical protein
MILRAQYLINEIVNVAPAAKSDSYAKSIYAENRLNLLKTELTDYINALEQQVKTLTDEKATKE